jgi:hypothetical protein
MTEPTTDRKSCSVSFAVRDIHCLPRACNGTHTKH